MAYGLLLYKQIASPEGTHRIEVWKDGYTGDAIEIDGLLRDSLTISRSAGDATEAITTSVLTFAIADTGQLDYSQFFTPNATLYKVIWKTTVENVTTTRWTGFLTPDSFSENLAYRDAITLTARDNLGRLNDYDFSLGRGQMLSVRSIINSGLAVAGVAMGVTFTTAKVASDPGTILAVDGLVNTSLLVGKTWHEALTLLLQGLGLTLHWVDNNVFDVRDITQAPASTQEAFFIEKSGYRQIRPAWKNVVVSQDYGLRSNFYEGQFTAAECGTGDTFTPTSPSLWEVTGTMALLNPYKAQAANPQEMVFIPVQGGETISAAMTYTFHAPSMAKAMKLVLKCSNSAWRKGSALRGGVWAQRKIQTGESHGQPVTHYYYLRYSFNIFATVGSTRYILRETWQEYDAATLENPYLYFVMPGSEGGIDEDNEVTFYLAELPGAADVEVVVYPVIAQHTEDGAAMETIVSGNYGRLSDITFTVCEGIGGRDKLITVNADHNIKSDLSLSLGRVPRSNGNALLYLGGLYYTDGDRTPIQEAARQSGGTEYDLLELVAREHIAFNNDNYDLLSGTMRAQFAFNFGEGITFEDTDYRIISASLSILSNTLQVQAMQTEPTFPTDAYTITDVDTEGGYGSGGYSGSSVPQGAQIGVDWFIKETYEVDGETYQRLKLNPAYTGMYALGFITAGGTGSGSGGGTGGSLATLADVALGTLADGDILHYDSTTSHWVNGPLSVALADLTDVSLGTPSNGQALVFDSSDGLWKPGTVQGGGGSGVTVISSDATIGTSLTTLGTIDGTAIKAKIASYLLSADFTAANIVSTLGTTAVNRAKADESGNNIKSYYVAGMNKASDGHNGYLLRVVNANGTTLNYVEGSDLVAIIGNTAVNRATADKNGNDITTTYLTSSSISDMATKTWVGQQNYLTSSAINDMATKTWVGQQNYITSSALSAYMQTADYTGSGTTPVNRAFGDESGNNIKANYGSSLVISDKKLYLRTKDTTLISYVTGSDIVTVIDTNAVARATADSSGNAFATAYLRKDTDDTMSANLTIGSSSANKSLTLYGTATITGNSTFGGNVTVGGYSSGQSTAKTVTIYGRNNASYPALILYGVASASSRYECDLYVASDGLHTTTAMVLGGGLTVSGNITATGNIVAGSASDRRLKDDIQTIEWKDACDILCRLRPVQYEWNGDAERLGGLTGVSRGFIADEYSNIIPNASRKIWGHYDAIDYNQVIPYLVAGWQAQQQTIRRLEGEIETLKRRLGDGI